MIRIYRSHSPVIGEGPQWGESSKGGRAPRKKGEHSKSSDRADKDKKPRREHPERTPRPEGAVPNDTPKKKREPSKYQQIFDALPNTKKPVSSEESSSPEE